MAQSLFRLRERNVSKGRTREKEAIVYIPVSECQSVMSSPPLSSLAIHRSSSRGFSHRFQLGDGDVESDNARS